VTATCYAKFAEASRAEGYASKTILFKVAGENEAAHQSDFLTTLVSQLFNGRYYHAATARLAEPATYLAWWPLMMHRIAVEDL
jgi:rubrerythrin